MKGETESDIAAHVAREVWAATHLFTRFGFRADCLNVTIRQIVGDLSGGEARAKNPRPWAVVQIHSLADGACLYVHPVAVVPSADLFAKAMKARVGAIATGLLDARTLEGDYRASDAFAHREQILDALLDRGFSVRTDLKDETEQPDN